MMREAEGINFKVGVPSDSDSKPNSVGKRVGYRHNNPNLNEIIFFIDSLSLSDSDKDLLKKVVLKVPHGALPEFRKNYINYIKGKG